MKKKKFKQNKNNKKNNTDNKKNLYDDIIVLKRKPSLKKKRKPEEPIEKIEYPKYTCSKCGEEIKELSSAIGDKDTGNPLHFKCVFEFLKNSEDLKEKEDLIYIGNGNFAIVHIENPNNKKNFKILRLIEWENKNQEYPWKKEIAHLASQAWPNPFIGCDGGTAFSNEEA